MTKVKKVSFKGWDNCYQISNEIAELIVTADIGPRIIKYALIGQVNEMCVFEDTAGKTGGDEWNLYGGHRLWHSPEAKPRSYFPDNGKVDVTLIENGIKTSQPVETTTMIKKELEITLMPDSSEVTIKHYLTNEGMWEIEVAAWALTVMAPGGLEIVPQEQFDTDLLPNRMISLWPYTKLNDHRVTWGEKYIFVKQDPECIPPFKFGISNSSGWAAYANHNHLFIKKFTHYENVLYPDYSGSSYETYTKHDMIELESLSPLVYLAPGETVEHIETWELHDHFQIGIDEDEVDRKILPLI
ncbi:MAG: hypothetical protein JXQ23_02900 [Clostridia bacterium]|nr:hypothetical protein [Clostridia bacterium]